MQNILFVVYSDHPYQIMRHFVNYYDVITKNGVIMKQIDDLGKLCNYRPPGGQFFCKKSVYVSAKCSDVPGPSFMLCVLFGYAII